MQLSASRLTLAAALIALAGCGGGASSGPGGTPVTPATSGPGTTGSAPAPVGMTPVPGTGGTSAPGTGGTPPPMGTMPGPTAPAGTPVPMVPGQAPAAVTGPAAGPAILYAPAAQPPQLANTGIWAAPPILVSGASAYRQGEYLYQDFLYDDHGATGTADSNQTNETVADLLAKFTGTYTYPTDPSYGANAADLVEFRMKPTAGATAFRVTLQTMIDPSRYAFTIGLGTSAAALPMPHGANAKEPAAVFVTVHGTTADVTNAVTGLSLGSGQVAVDQTRRQIQVLVPYALYDTRGATGLRVAVACGLWNGSTNAYLVPGATSSMTAGGGAGSLLAPPAFYNVGFRHAEPAYGTNNVTSMGTYWRESAQAAALANGDLSSFADTVDMTKLAAGASDDMHGAPQGVPTTGNIVRILPSHFEPFQGRAFTGCQGTNTHCPPEYGGALEPYTLYVPVERPRANGYPLTLLLHSLSVNYNQYQNTMNQMEFGERNGGSLVFTTEGRGPDDWYYDLAEAEVFETWADVARNYPVDPTYTAMTGYSMGGYATWKLAALFPDLFGVMQPTVGPAYVGMGDGDPTDTKPMFGSYRNLPILSWHASADELVPTPKSLEEEQQLAALGLNFEYDLFSPAEHVTLSVDDQFAPAATFLGLRPIDPNPSHVTYVRNTSMDSATYGAVAGHAYWLSSVAQRSASIVTGSLDVRSGSFGVGDPPASGITPTSGTLTGGTLGSFAYTGLKNAYGAPPAQPVSDVLVVNAVNVASATIETARAKVDCAVQLQVTSDGPFALALDGCPGGPHAFARGRTVVRAAAVPFGRR